MTNLKSHLLAYNVFLNFSTWLRGHYMQAVFHSLGFKLGDMQMWHRFFHSKLGLTLASLVLGVIATLGFAPYGFWVITLITLAFEFFLVASLNTKKQVFWSLWLYFTALNAATLSWLNFVMHGFGQMPLPLSWLLEILLSAYLAVFHGLLGCLVFHLAHRFIPPVNNKARTSSSKTSIQQQSDCQDKTVAQDHTATHQEQVVAQDKNSEQKYDFDDEEEDDDDAYQDEPCNAPTNAVCDTGHMHFYRNAFLLCLLPVALIVADYLVGIVFTGFPWMYIGYIALEGPFASYAPLLGVRGISLILFICAGALALTLERRYVYLPVAGILFAIGIFCQGLNFTQDLPAIKVTGIQGNIAQQIKWDPNQVMPTIGHYVNQSMPYFGNSDLIVWPESALPVFAQEIDVILQDLNSVSHSTQTPLLMGIQHLEIPEYNKIDTFNSIYLLGTNELLSKLQLYKKRQLVPFGESVPFASVTRKLGSIFNFPMSGFSHGSAQQQQLSLKLTHTHASEVDANLLAEPTSSSTSTDNSNHQVLDKADFANAQIDFAHNQPSLNPKLAQPENANINKDSAQVITEHENAVVIGLDSTYLEEEDIAIENYPEGELIATNLTIAEPQVSSQSTVQEPNTTNSLSDNATVASNSQAKTLAQTKAETWPDADVDVSEKEQSQTNSNDILPQEVSDEELIATVKTTVTNEDLVFTQPTNGALEKATLNTDIEELAAGEKDWFASDIPAMPNNPPRKLAQTLDLKFIPAICYESIFPELMTSLHDEHTNGIIMISNDSWFGNTRGPDEHLAIARMRSMEMQKPMIRITNSGHTVLIDKTGKITQKLPQDKLAVLHADFIPNQGMTPYVRLHNIPLYVILVLLFACGIYLRQQEINTLRQNLEALVRP